MATLPITEKHTPTTQTPPPAHRVTLALALDPERALHLAPTFQPDVDLLTAEGLIAFGVKGSGKSNLLALLAEQLGRFLLPQVILDTEREYQSLLPLLPHGILASASRFPSGSDILHNGLQVILDLQSWETDEAAALAMCQLIRELFTATSAIAPKDRVPCILHLDEAAYWLPQEAVSYLSKERRKALADAFHKLASRGRKQGLTPFLYTQSISEVAKSVIRQAGIKVLMRQTLDIDLTRYCQFIQGATPQTKKAIQAYPSGKAIVLLPDGSQHRVQFQQRESEHVSQTPRSQAALVKFAVLSLDVEALPMRDLTRAAPSEQGQQAGKPAPLEKVSEAHIPTTATERVDALLAENPTLRPVDLMKAVGCSESLARKARIAYFEQHPERQGAAGHLKGQPTVTERVYELLSLTPSLRVVDLMKLAKCSKTTASRARITYFEQHPERAAEALPAKGQHSVTERVAALLSLNPTLRPAALMKLAQCSESAASKARRIYFERHPDLTPAHKTATERIYELLAADPTLRPVDLWKLVGCDQALAGRARSAYFAAHPERGVPVEPVKRPEPMAERVVRLLAENPTLRVVDLMKAVGCSKPTASKARLAYLAARPEQRIEAEQGVRNV